MRTAPPAPQPPSPPALACLPSRVRTKDESQRELADDEVAAICAEFMLAGSDTSASTSTLAVYFLCTHPHVRKQVVAEIDAYFEKLGDGGDVAGKPTFDELDQFPYLEQVEGMGGAGGSCE